MDVLSGILSSMKLSGSVFLESEFTAPWCVSSQLSPDDCTVFFPEAAHVISYHYLISGRLLCRIGSEEPVEVQEGQILLVPHNERHYLGSCFTSPPIDAHELIQPCQDGGLLSINFGGGGDVTRIYCGYLGTVTPINSFLLSLPSILLVDASAGPAGEWLASSIRYAGAATHSGSPEMIGRLAELLFAEAVRQYIETIPEHETGWLAGLKDPFVSKALTLLHTRYAEPWTTSDLAREVGMSRSAFADRFTSLLHEPPMRYFARLRMNLAANLLREGRQNASNVAYTVGFNSEAAFNRAFKKEFGIPPGSWRKAAA